MKNSLLLACLLFALLACNNQKQDNTDTTASAEVTSEDVNVPSILGVWEMESQYTYDGEDVIDTSYYREGYRQIKIYTPEKVMWSRQVPLDSIEWFGYGSYRVEDGRLIETIEYGSASMLRALDTIRVFSFELVIDENSYSQITTDEVLGRISSENYKRLE